jgi:ribose/xylose/arabinose/galactoside ABC-type transport system permease subunit
LLYRTFERGVYSMSVRVEDTTAAKRAITGQEISRIFSKYWVYIAFIVIFIALSIASDSFLTINNLSNILRQVSIIGIVAVGMTFVIIAGGIDLSVGSVIGLSAVITTSMAQASDSLPLVVPLAAGLFVGALAGTINGYTIAKWAVAPFIVTLGMMTVARGLALVYTDGRPIISLSDTYTTIGKGYALGIPIPTFIFAIVIFIAIFVLNFTKFGRYVFATGGNELSAKLSGINTTFIKMMTYSIAGFASAIGGIILSSRVMSGSPVLGTGYELDAIAAVVIGGTS